MNRKRLLKCLKKQLNWNNSAHLGLAQAYQDLGKNEMAYQQYQVVLSRIPNLNTVRLDYANLLADMQKNTEAISQYNMYIKAFPNDINGYKNIAAVYKELGNFDKALENFLIAETKDNTDINLKKDIALCYHNKKEYQNAIKYYDQILTANANDYEVKVNKAIALHALHKYDDPIKGDKTIRENLNNALVARGHELVASQNYDQAVENFKTAIKNGYTDGFVYYGLAKAYRAAGDNTKASENYEKAISIDPDKTVYSAEYSDFISSLYQPKVNVKPSENPEELPSISISMEETPAAGEKAAEKTVESTQPIVQEKTLETKPKTNGQPVIKTSSITLKQNEEFILEGDKNYKNNNFDAAIKNYQDALQIVPNDAETLLKIGNIYQMKKENTKAVNFYQKSIIVNPDYTDGWFNLGIAYANENNYIEAQKSFERIISLDSDYNSGYAYYALGMALEQQGKIPEAVKNYKLFIKQNKNKNEDKSIIDNVQQRIKQLQ